MQFDESLCSSDSLPNHSLQRNSLHVKIIFNEPDSLYSQTECCENYIHYEKIIVFSTFFNVFHELIFAGGRIFYLSGTGGDHRCAVFTIEPDSRGAAMGNTGVAIADNASAMFWNPAGLAFQRGNQVSITHSNWLANFNVDDLFYDYLVGKYYVEGIGTIGAHLTYLNLGEQIQTNEDSLISSLSSTPMNWPWAFYGFSEQKPGLGNQSPAYLFIFGLRNYG